MSVTDFNATGLTDDVDLLSLSMAQFYEAHDRVVARHEAERSDPGHRRTDTEVRPPWPQEWRTTQADHGVGRQLSRFWCAVLQQAILEACEEYFKRDQVPAWVGSRGPREVGNLAGLNGEAVAEVLQGHFTSQAGVTDLHAAIRTGASHETRKAARGQTQKVDQL
tara:strand:- start:19245 stop:19739 length:495 start_codon:yes stop_codon:yes gene_type:complete